MTTQSDDIESLPVHSTLVIIDVIAEVIKGETNSGGVEENKLNNRRS